MAKVAQSSMQLKSAVNSLFVALVAAGAWGQDKPLATAIQAPAGPAKEHVASAGIANDWLREQSGAFQPWDIGGEFRVRYDFKQNAGEGSSSSVDFMRDPPSGAFNDNRYLIFREKVHVGYTPVDWLTGFVGARDAVGIGDRRDPPRTDDRFDLEQAWLRLGSIKTFPITLKLGRQELSYGDERMLGRSDWNNLGSRVFDAVLLRFEIPELWVDAFAGRPVMPDNHNFNMPNDYDWLSGLYASTRTLAPWQESQLYFLAHNVSAKSALPDPGWIGRASTPQDTHTVGLRFKSLPEKLKGWDYNVETAAQLGNVKIGAARRQHQAFAVMSGGGYSWKQAWGMPRLGIGYDFFSGDGDPSDNRNGTFEPLFPTNHRPLGLMDLVGPRNIHDPRVTFLLKPARWLLVNLEWHSYWLADSEDYFYSDGGSARNSNGYGRNPGFNSYTGSELDLDLTCTLKPWAAIRAGYGHFFVGDYVEASLESAGGSQDANWFYTQVTFVF